MGVQGFTVVEWVYDLSDSMRWMESPRNKKRLPQDTIKELRALLGSGRTRKRRESLRQSQAALSPFRLLRYYCNLHKEKTTTEKQSRPRNARKAPS